jgi:PPOX class probable F420-dependent enzyme
MAELSEKGRKLFEEANLLFVATVNRDGSPQVTPVWTALENGNITFNTAVGGAKERNLRRDPRVALSIQDPDNPYRYLEVRGRVAEITERGADEHIDRMAKKYMGLDKYPHRQPGEVRVLYKIRPEHTTSMG